MGDCTIEEPIHLKMWISGLQILILVVLAIISALHPTAVSPPMSNMVNGNWSNFTDNTTCSVSCGGGFKIQLRKCDNPSPLNDGKTCPGPFSRVMSCNNNNCPINGNWGRWLDNETCSVTCGGGFRTLYRSCDYPAPAYGGLTCYGSNTMTVNCNNNPCPVHGNWGQWTLDTPCTVSCGGGVSAQIRQCDSPAPSLCGELCQGNSSQVTTCNTNPCPINGNLTDWIDANCSKSCGGGTKTQIRTCTNPAPQYGGAPCTGLTTKTLPCNSQICPVNANWGAWQDYTPCSVTCGTGRKTQVRTCNNPVASNCGATCPGNSTQIVSCQSGAACTACGTPPYTKDNGQNVCGFLASSGAFSAAAQTCIQKGGLLPEIRSARENGQIASNRPPSAEIWLNSNDLARKSSYVWLSDNSPVTYTSWDSNQPDNFFNSEDCLQMYPNGNWNDRGCGASLTTYCELYFP